MNTVEELKKIVVPLKVTELDLKVLQIFYNTWSEDGEMWRGCRIKRAAKESKLTQKQVRRVMRSLAKRGLLIHQVCTDQDGVPSGSAYFCTKLGAQFAQVNNLTQKDDGYYY